MLLNWGEILIWTVEYGVNAVKQECAKKALQWHRKHENLIIAFVP